MFFSNFEYIHRIPLPETLQKFPSSLGKTCEEPRPGLGGCWTVAAAPPPHGSRLPLDFLRELCCIMSPSFTGILSPCEGLSAPETLAQISPSAGCLCRSCRLLCTPPLLCGYFCYLPVSCHHHFKPHEGRAWALGFCPTTPRAHGPIQERRS